MLFIINVFMEDASWKYPLYMWSPLPLDLLAQPPLKQQGSQRLDSEATQCMSHLIGENCQSHFEFVCIHVILTSVNILPIIYYETQVLIQFVSHL